MNGARMWRSLALGAALACMPPCAAADEAAAAAADAAPAPAFLGGLLSESRVLYPLQVGPWSAVSEHRYPDQRFGVSVRYVDGERWIDLYFYPGGLQDEHALATVAATERDNIGLAARQSGREARLGALEPLSLPYPAGEDGRMPAWRLGLSYPGEQRASAMLLFARDMYLVKARASAPQPSSSPAQLVAEVQAFMAEVAAQLRIASTGACWLPSRLELVDALPAPDAAGVLASYRDRPDRDPAAVATGHGVRVARSEAARAPELAAAFTARLYPGCVAPETIEPEVPASLREIRIEYRLPAGDEAGTRGPGIGRPRAPLRGTG